MTVTFNLHILSDCFAAVAVPLAPNIHFLLVPFRFIGLPK